MTDPIKVGDDPHAAVRAFFERLGAYCAAVDYDSAEALFAEDVASFGTKAVVVRGRDPLRRDQWENIWGRITDFRFDLDGLHSAGDANIAWGMAGWTSTGYGEDGDAFERPGRATVVLEHRGDAWYVVHTHFSLAPGTPQRTFGVKLIQSPRTPKGTPKGTPRG